MNYSSNSGWYRGGLGRSFGFFLTDPELISCILDTAPKGKPFFSLVERNKRPKPEQMSLCIADFGAWILYKTPLPVLPKCENFLTNGIFIEVADNSVETSYLHEARGNDLYLNGLIHVKFYSERKGSPQACRLSLVDRIRNEATNQEVNFDRSLQFFKRLKRRISEISTHNAAFKNPIGDTVPINEKVSRSFFEFNRKFLEVGSDNNA